jgi:hypothetical protein
MSTIKVTNIEHGSTTNGGIQLDNAGHVTVDGQQLPTAGALSNRNLIINGAMNIAQRGTSSTDEGYHTVDRYFIQRSGGTVTQTQTGITSGSPYDEGFRNVLRLTNTATNTGVNGHRNAFQYIEAQNLAQSGWNYTSSSSYVTLSFWVRSSVAQEFFGYLRTFDGTEQGYSFSTGTLSANTWTKVTKAIPGNSNITINNDSGAGLQVNISPFWGTNYTDPGNTTESWGAFSSGSRTPDYTNTWANTTNATFDITGLQLEVGEKATPFEHRSYGEELHRCKRYYQELDLGTNNNVLHMVFSRFGASNGNAFAYFPFPTAMRAAPSFSFLGETFNSSGYTGNPSLGAATINGAQLNSANSFNAGANAYLRPNNDSGDFLRLTFNSEL